MCERVREGDYSDYVSLLYSFEGVSLNSSFPPVRDHAQTEMFLESCGIPFISLINRFYISSGQFMLDNWIKKGDLALPKYGPINWTSHEDLADGIAKILIDVEFDEKYPELTSSQAVTLQDIAF